MTKPRHLRPPRTHCLHGHPWVKGNLIRRSRIRNGKIQEWDSCKTCADAAHLKLTEKRIHRKKINVISRFESDAEDPGVRMYRLERAKRGSTCQVDYSLILDRAG